MGRVFIAGLLAIVLMISSTSALTCDGERCCELAFQGMMYYAQTVVGAAYLGQSADAFVYNNFCGSTVDEDIFNDCEDQDNGYFYPDELVRVCPRNYALAGENTNAAGLKCESQNDLTVSLSFQFTSLQDCLTNDDVNINYDSRQCLDYWYSSYDRCMRDLGLRGGN
mmetsp:Transcript_19632/g.27048  ORF Transcript_19632/g.27048 Transcript_19632/m.27048 type:complete len:167 (-) Transcript_19632:77-577(-)|eukprot:CAMPEP_0201477270 /NCGR_PEP_ID=MMETSP0151_2-20130828/2324_1 /ASSEMBLY_ACC=CAM_ASM_000257 /TAXON_ID=200890 /ORGANISM="Paramoeba atlantica, Strain 621/1 / CCAP 1560/9" /LENGTH=166 /DNA_ID=CAMNT_0047857931 /DNA_START=96 /DNA_END=596 /DNA_ORIENTATION=+